MMHRTQKIRKFWSSIAPLAHCKHCRTCGLTKSMEHILTKYRDPPVQIIWSLVERAWPNKHLNWPRISIRLILGCSCIRKCEENG